MKLRISPSTMSRLFCDTKTLLSHWGWTSRTTGVALQVGKVLDEAISGILNGKFYVVDAYNHIFRWSQEFEGELDEEYSCDNLQAILGEWYGRHLSPESRPENRFPFDKLYAVQKSFETSIGSLRVSRLQSDDVEVAVIGVIDWIGETTEWLWVVDLKTTRKNIRDERYRLSFELGPQLPSYVDAVARKMERPVRGAYIAAIQMKKLPNSTKKCSTHGTPYAECGNQHLIDDFFLVNLPADSNEMWKRQAMEAARDYYRLLTTYTELSDLPKARMQGTMVYDACINCEFRSFCKANRPIDRIEEYLVQRVPEEGHIKSGLEA